MTFEAGLIIGGLLAWTTVAIAVLVMLVVQRQLEPGRVSVGDATDDDFKQAVGALLQDFNERLSAIETGPKSGNKTISKSPAKTAPKRNSISRQKAQ